MGVRTVRKKGLLSVKIPGLSKTVAEKPAPRAKASAEARPKVSIDYPQEGERVHCGHYAIRITGGDGESQISIDEGPWQPCRCDAGFHWHDWFPETAGTHRLLVRSRLNGRWAKAERVCDVE